MKRVRIEAGYGRVEVWVDGRLKLDEDEAKTDDRTVDLYRKIAELLERELANAPRSLAIAK